MWISKIKGLTLVLAVLLVVFIASFSAYAEGPTRLGPFEETETYVSINDYIGTEVDKGLIVEAATIGLTVKYHRILGFSVVPQDGNYSSELTLGLYDTTTADLMTATTLFDEAEWDDDGNNQPRWYPYPKRLASGLSLIQGPNTVAIIYYEDMRGQ